ncbi:related to ESBP6-similarity to Monocarboxylate transporter [Sporisorium reilianum SRZ2]|uniref:Related to ESBP6-similarity to Monocarboxylate transporter n=2 Tax=Sporisorium reilianum TaxID=72558 RepID=E6ZJI8_SPORE|nr:related to ESBP6-similarity to Monocarboxylate transporter [Sporisorium reilianum SRZ2]SJX60129.1 related to ESBP6-similarity to Monocarboxylate transporter [Sporisorium reilianum f. sp. reilianum]
MTKQLDATEAIRAPPTTASETPDSTHIDLATTDNVRLSDAQFSIREGGYGWVNVVCSIFVNAVTWGVNTTFGVYFSYYLQHDYFTGATPMRYAYVGGLSVAACMLAAPFSNLLWRSSGWFKTPLYLGMVFVTMGQVGAGLCRTYVQLLFTQGLVFGIGLGLIMVPTQPLLSQWFRRKLSYAQGLSAAGSGLGGLVLANTTRYLIQEKSLEYALICNGIVSFVVLLPCITLMKSTEPQTPRFLPSGFRKSKTESSTTTTSTAKIRKNPLELKWLVHPGYAFVLLFGVFSMIGYFVALYSLAAFASSGLGLTQKQASTLQSILAAGQMVGRPLCGLLLDLVGRHPCTIVIQTLAGLTCFAFWLPARSFGLLVVFAVTQGLLGGTIWSSVAPLSAEVVGIRDLPSALAVFWLVTSVPGQFGQPMAVALINYSQKRLGRRGADAYLISIGFCGACFVMSGVMLCMSWRFVRSRNRVQQLESADQQTSDATPPSESQTGEKM